MLLYIKKGKLAVERFANSFRRFLSINKASGAQTMTAMIMSIDSGMKYRSAIEAVSRGILFHKRHELSFDR